MEINKYLLYIFAFNFNFVLSFDIISLEILYSINNTFNNDISSIYYNLQKTYAYSYIKIGEPEYTIKTMFSFSSPHFSLMSNYELIDEAKKLIIIALKIQKLL
jgi:hypothetical protein